MQTYSFNKPYLKKFFLKVFTEFVKILLLFYVLAFGRKACGILAPWPGIESVPTALEGEVLTTGPPGKSPQKTILNTFYVPLECEMGLAYSYGRC